MRVIVKKGDITEERVDAVVNAANPSLLGGGGVDGAIHRAAGPELLEACMALPELEPEVRCYLARTQVTPAFNLPATHIIHTVGPIFRKAGPLRPGEVEAGGMEPELMLHLTYINCLKAAEKSGCKSIAFPAISCGVYGCPIEKGAEVAGRVLMSRAWGMDEVVFVLFTDLDHSVFQETFRVLGLIQ